MAGQALSLPQTTIGKKAIMAASSIILMGFLVGHLGGNLLIFAENPEHAVNSYSNWLREFGHGSVIWIVRATLIAAVLGHIWGALTITARNRAARPVAYRRKQSLRSTLASRTMVYGGMALLGYIVYHLAHLTFHAGIPGGHNPNPNPDLYPLLDTNVYANLVDSFANPGIAGIYVLAQVFLGLHLYHGAWSFLQTLGASHPRYNETRKLAAAAFAGLISVGFILIPLGVQFGLVK